MEVEEMMVKEMVIGNKVSEYIGMEKMVLVIGEIVAEEIRVEEVVMWEMVMNELVVKVAGRRGYGCEGDGRRVGCGG